MVRWPCKAPRRVSQTAGDVADTFHQAGRDLRERLYLDRALALWPDDPDVLYNRAQLMYQDGKFRKALADLDVACARGAELIAWLLRGMVKYELDDYLGALADLNWAARLQANHAGVLYWRARVKYELEDYNGALDDYRDAQDGDDDREDAWEEEEDVMYRMALTKLQLHDLDGALEDLDEAHKLHPAHASTLFCRGRVKFEQRDFHGALDDLQRAADKVADAATLFWRGRAKFELGDIQGALADLQRSDQLDRDDAATLLWLARVKLAQGNLA